MADEKDEKIDRIFCAYDFSETADVALEQAVRFARRHRGLLILAHVVEPIPLGPYPILTPPHAELEIVEIARKKIEALAETLRDEGTQVDVRVEQGQPGPHLVTMAEEMGADLFVIGTRGLTGLKHLTLGSTAEYVVRCCECPVLTVHPEDRVLRSSIETVILPTDFSTGAAHAVEAFIALFGEWESPRVFLTYADRTPPYLDPFKHETLERLNQPDVMKEEIEEKLQPIADQLRAADFEVEVAVLDGDPVTATAEIAEETGADLVLLSTKGRGAILNALLGRTAQRIVQFAPCPVLTIRTPEE